MAKSSRIRSVLTAVCLYLGAAMLIGYFGVNAYTGNHGLRAKQDLDRLIAQSTAELEAIRAERAVWERRVGLLRSDNLDPDMLDERARVLLNLAQPNEIVLQISR